MAKPQTSKQEMFKGRAVLGGTTWAGWEFDGKQVGNTWIRSYSADEANAATEGNLQTNAVFMRCPSTMFAATIDAQHINEILACGIPALSYAVGFNDMYIPGLDRNYDANKHKPNQWGRNDPDYQSRWLHSDVKNMAYLYTFDMFDLITRLGVLGK